MEEVKKASEVGKEVPPGYVNVTDAVSLSPFFLFNLLI